MKIIRRIFFVITIIWVLLLLLMIAYVNSGYQLYFDFGIFKLGNSNNNIIYVIVGCILFTIATYFLIRYIVKKRGIIISIILYFSIFMLPFFFLITNGMNKNYSFDFKTESNKHLLIMGYGNKKEDNMKYVIYENLFLGFYDKIGEIEEVGFKLSKDNIVKKDLAVEDNYLYYSEEDKTLYLVYKNSIDEMKLIELKYKH